MSALRPDAGFQLIVLLGPPGSGKTTIGRELARLGMGFEDRERQLVERYGDRDSFLRTKEAALSDMHAQVLADIARSERPVVYESTGLSEADFLFQLEREFRTLFVRLDVPREVARSRIASRSKGEHVTDDPAAAERVFDAFAKLVLPERAVNLVIDTTRLDAAAAAAAIIEQVYTVVDQ